MYWQPNDENAVEFPDDSEPGEANDSFKGVFINKLSEGAGLEFSQTSKKVVTHQNFFCLKS